MQLASAYITVILIWSTTPLAVKWSGEQVGPLFGLSGRMVISLVVCALVVMLWRIPMPLNRATAMVYMFSGLTLYGAMTMIYWAATFIPSGWISVIFGLTPMVTGLVAWLWIGEKSKIHMIVGMTFGLSGLAVVFVAGQSMVGVDPIGIGLALIATVIHSVGMVFMKKFAAGLNPITSTTGGITVALPLYLVTWFLVDGRWPAAIPSHSAASIIYLGVVGSVIGFTLYFYLLKRCSAHTVALVTLITPITALLLGHFLNDEILSVRVWLGCALVVMGLVCYQWGEYVLGWFGSGVHHQKTTPQTGTCEEAHSLKKSC